MLYFPWNLSNGKFKVHKILSSKQGLRRDQKSGGSNFDEILARLYREFKKIK